jgi:hypothetical protein
MNLSANSLFHFTDDFDKLTSILGGKFHGSYCKEQFHHNGVAQIMIIPKISFCDIPLKTISNIHVYGNYGIGLTKDWGMRNKLNPVLYLEKNASLKEIYSTSLEGTLSLGKLINDMQRNISMMIDQIKDRPLTEEYTLKQKLLHLDEVKEVIEKLHLADRASHFNQYSMNFVKHYEDDLIRNGTTTLNYRFYDEREWCFIPDFDTSTKLHINNEQYTTWRGDTSKRKPSIPDFTLNFEFEDIQHIIVATEDEISTMVGFINNLPCPTKQRDLLFTRIKSIEKLRSDY